MKRATLRIIIALLVGGELVGASAYGLILAWERIAPDDRASIGPGGFYLLFMGFAVIAMVLYRYTHPPATGQT